MCRWNAYFGQPVLIDELLFRTEHSLIEQSLHSRMGVETTNGDGFALHPDNARFQRMTGEDRVVVSEPVSDLPGVWREVPESTAPIIQRGPDEQREFHPQPPADAIATPRTVAAATAH